MAIKTSETKIIIIQGIIFLMLLFGMGLLLEGCTDKCNITQTYTYYEPVYMSYGELRSSVAYKPAETMDNPGKIYLKGNYIFVGEAGKGIHVINNADKTAPENVGFINIPGNNDMAVLGNILYADSYVDLVAIDIGNLQDIKEVKRLENIFPNYSELSYYGNNELGVVTKLMEVEDVEKLELGCDESPARIFRGNAELFAMSDASRANMSTLGVVAGAGKGGSMARFTLYQNYLYAIDQANMHVFDVTLANDPVKSNDVNIGWGIETIFPYKDKLFIGAQNGMHIYDNADPVQPVHLSTFSHVTSCDPVVVEGDLAYVTLRGNNVCQGFANQLDVIDIKDLLQPKLVKSYPMQNPHGLGILQGTLFLCEGEYGLKVFDAEDELKIDENLLAHFKEYDAYDVIPYDHFLILIGKDGLYQFDVADPANIKLLSKIKVESKRSV